MGQDNQPLAPFQGGPKQATVKQQHHKADQGAIDKGSLMVFEQLSLLLDLLLGVPIHSQPLPLNVALVQPHLFDADEGAHRLLGMTIF